jgi:hypothetical protein
LCSSQKQHTVLNKELTVTVHIAATKNSTKCNLEPKLLEHKSNSLTYPTTTTQQTNILVKQKPLTPQPNSKQNTTQTQKPTNSRIEKKWHSNSPQPRKTEKTNGK